MILKNYRKRERNLTTLNHFCKNEDAEKIGEGAKSEARTASMKECMQNWVFRKSKCAKGEVTQQKKKRYSYIKLMSIP